MDQQLRDTIARFRIIDGKGFDLSKFDPAETVVANKQLAEEQVEDDAKLIDRLQDQLFAERKRALLVVLQGTDTSGKDGTIRSLFERTSPLGVQVASFGTPTALELAHDYLWRVHAACPSRGHIGIFNRSHYEDVLVVKVRKLADAAAIEKRYAEINDFERMLTQNGTTIVKLMLNISRKEQGERLRERAKEADKRWKFNPRDLEDRALWDEFRDAYETMIRRTSTSWAPWYVVPADKKWNRDFLAASIVVETLEKMDPRYPDISLDPKAYDFD
ncbi:MAG: polyphosphate kinase 2 family protein [Bauldia sp.]|nr:polyphosphate kinase 2 family protein [Bauldia sp.]